MTENRCVWVEGEESFQVLILGGLKMHRDDDFLRALLQEMEASDQWMHLSAIHLSSPPEEMKRHFHIQLLVDAGMLAAMKSGSSAYRITNAGHDFLGVTRQQEVWEAAKAGVRHLGGASVQMLYRVAEGYARQKLADLGIPIT